jgi:hypothetical protein
LYRRIPLEFYAVFIPLRHLAEIGPLNFVEIPEFRR